MHRHSMRAFAILVLLVLIASLGGRADAATIVVKKGTMVSTIQAGIDIAVTAPLGVFEANTFSSGGPITVPEIN
ncbi:MAG: hypothetical protein IPH13_10930 [Planctomycetes bacterium]|nr:hypothetical protein [Planctomycetota bacterium]MCC7172342.1 hypothetical protein [Planctomycetota bacterium]